MLETHRPSGWLASSQTRVAALQQVLPRVWRWGGLLQPALGLVSAAPGPRRKAPGVSKQHRRGLFGRAFLWSLRSSRLPYQAGFVSDHGCRCGSSIILHLPSFC